MATPVCPDPVQSNVGVQRQQRWSWPMGVAAFASARASPEATRRGLLKERQRGVVADVAGAASWLANSRRARSRHRRARSAAATVTLTWRAVLWRAVPCRAGIIIPSKGKEREASLVSDSRRRPGVLRFSARRRRETPSVGAAQPKSARDKRDANRFRAFRRQIRKPVALLTRNVQDLSQSRKIAPSVNVDCHLSPGSEKIPTQRSKPLGARRYISNARQSHNRV